MDRFVWFVLLVVMSHLVTEFTRVTGYARGNRHDVVLINDTTLQPKTVSNMIFYPGEEYGVYEQQMSQYSNFYPINNNKYSSNNNYNNYNGNPNMQPLSASNGESAAITFPFSFRPLIDSIFEIPISTLRAVNNLVARLTGSYQHQVPSMTAGVLKSTNANESPDALEAYRSLQAASSVSAAATTATNTRTPPTSFNSHLATTQNDDKTSNLDNKDGNRVIRLQRRSLLREVNA